MKKLYNYLEKIKAGKAINFPQFVEALPGNIAVDKDLIFKARMVKAKQYVVEILDPVVFEQLYADCAPKGDDKVAAALGGDSHKIASSHGFVLVFHLQLSHARPDVVVVNEQGFSQGFVSNKTLLVIENQENFFRYQQMLPILSEFYGQSLSLANCDIAFGIGQQINKALNLSFLDQYDNVLCAFDYDLGALRMVETLKHNLQAKVEYLLPAEFKPWQRYFCRVPDNDQQFGEAIKLAEKLAYPHLAQAFRQTAKFLEQEVFLATNIVKGN